MLVLYGLLGAVQHEAMLFAAIGLAIGGTDDMAIDLVYFGRLLWRRATVYRSHPPMTTATLPAPAYPAPLAIFVPVWHEAQVIGPMLRGALGQWGVQDYRIFVGVYPNDPDTLAAIAPLATGDPRILIAVNPRAGPTTKGDNLNILWAAMLRDEAARGLRYKAVVLHDAEDVVHPDALRLLSRLTDRFALVQLPVLPLRSPRSFWIAGHYCDEFAESHHKSMVVREALGAAVPSAGVGCAFARDALAGLARGSEGPFDPDSLTEDYELGLRIAEQGGTGIFVRMRDTAGALVCTREHFPETRQAAVKQKARWMVGIALAGWDRLGWHGGWAEHWMRLRDRCAALAAIVLAAAYLAMALYALLWCLRQVLPLPDIEMAPFLESLLWFNLVLAIWRAMMRALFVTRGYGWREGLYALPRMVTANIIAIMAARRAIGLYARMLRGSPVVWDKTAHRHPGEDAEAHA